MTAIPKVEAFDVVIIVIALVFYRSAPVLFNPRSTFSYESTLFIFYFNIMCEPPRMPLHVSIYVGNSLIVDHIYRSYWLSLWAVRLG